jgi:hypothetical protein
MHLNVDLAAAAMILALVLNGGPMPQAAMAEGARRKLASPSLPASAGRKCSSQACPAPSFRSGGAAGTTGARKLPAELWDPWSSRRRGIVGWLICQRAKT